MYLPPELSTVVSTEGYTLLLQGEVGVGKTVLGLEFLSQTNNPYYLSIVGHSTHVHQRYPWIAEHLTPTRIIDLRETINPALRTPRIKSFKNRLMRMISGEQKELPIIFINGWIAFLQSLGISASSWPQWHHTLIEITRQKQWRFIIATNIRDDQLEEIVDGVIQLFRRPIGPLVTQTSVPSTETSHREIRILDLRKLTSIPIHQRYYVYSIAGDRFRYLPPPTYTLTIPQSKPILSTSSHISTGIREFDTLINGGYPRGCATLLEVTASVARRRHPLIHATAVNALRTGIGLLYLVEEDIPLLALINNHLLPYVGEPKLKHLYLACLLHEDFPECQNRKDVEGPLEPPGFCQTPLHPDDIEKTLELLNETREIIHSRYEAQIELIESLTLERLYSSSNLPLFLMAAKESAWQQNNALLFIADHTTAYNQRLRRLTDFHLLLDTVEGVPILQGLTPHFDPHAIEIHDTTGITLTPIS